MRRVLLICGIVASLVYLAANAIVPMWFEGYDWVSQTVSELSAIDAPTRRLWMAMMVPFTLLMLAFCGGIWMSAGSGRALRLAAVCGWLHIGFGALWPPMHLRGAEMTITDTLHIAWTAVVVPLMMMQIGFAAAALGRWFRVYSVLTITGMIAFGFMTSLEAPNIATGGPTPLIGLWERIGMAPFFVWVPVLAVRLWRAD